MIYAESDVSVFSFAEIINALQTSNAAGIKEMDRVLAVIKQLLPRREDALSAIPSAQKLRRLLLARIPRDRRIHACSQDCVMFINEHATLHHCPRCGRAVLRVHCWYSGPCDVFRAIPIGSQLRLLFANPLIAQFLLLQSPHAVDADTKINDITESAGFNEVVWASSFSATRAIWFYLAELMAVTPSIGNVFQSTASGRLYFLF